jgi:hypothetical protein
VCSGDTEEIQLSVMDRDASGVKCVHVCHSLNPHPYI